MKIVRVEPFDLQVPLPKPITDSMNYCEKWGLPGVNIYADEGICGTGFTGTLSSGDDLIVPAIEKYLGPILLGQDPFNVKKIWEDLYGSRLHWVGRAGITHMAHAAIDIALWDLMAKAAGKPLWQLLGGHKPSRILAYNTDGGWLNWTQEELVTDCKRLIDAGFRGVKVKIGKPTPREDYARVKAVRQAIGEEILLMVDVNQKWDLNTAKVWGKRLEEFNVYWLEEPLHPDDIAGHAQLARELNVPIALGEHVYTRFAFRDYIVAGAVEFVQVDVTRVAGVTEWLQVADLAGCFNLPVCPHVGDMMQIHQHLVAATPNATMQEYIPWVRHIFVEPATVQEGFFQVPERPGASTEIKPQAFQQYRVR